MSTDDRRREDGRRLAAIGALSAAGLALTGAEAEAGIVVTTVNQDIGFAAGDVSAVTLDALPTVGNKVLIAATPGTTGNFHLLLAEGVQAKGFKLGVYLLGQTTFASRFNKGATLNQAVLKTSAGFIAVVNQTSGSASGTFTDKYFLFSFQDASNKTLYGWIEGSLTDNSYDNGTYHLTAYAYDDTGAVIHAGDTGATVPEPGAATLGLLGAAMVGGAAGVRRWKKARASATAD